MVIISYSVVDKTVGSNDNVTISENGQKYVFGFPCGESTAKCTPYEVTLGKGVYLFEVWGAEGGSSCWGTYFSQSGGRGGYSVGVFPVTTPTKVYIYVGGRGASADESFTIKEGGFNGGGFGGTDSSKNCGSSGGGGGATDIRHHLDNLYSRIIVAGGGSSGSTNNINLGGLGAAGGGEEGEYFNSSSAYAINGMGGTQTKGGETFTGRNATCGIFGIGGNGSTGYPSNGGSAGGGGYFGGGGGSSAANHGSPTGGSGIGGGGSGYVGGVFDFPRLSIKKETISGVLSFPYPYGTEETGHMGNGLCRITVIKNVDTCRIRPISFNAFTFFLSLIITTS
jgi:hypothetical protein